MPDGPVSTFDNARIDAHNRRIKAFRDRYDPLVAAITREQAEAIVDLGLRQGLGMKQVAHAMRGRLDFDIPLDRDIAIGVSLYGRALEMLDLYDADFRPRPEIHEMARLGDARLDYHAATGEYEVVLGDRSERFPSSHAPRFGVDAADMARAAEIAERLAGTVPGP